MDDVLLIQSITSRTSYSIRPMLGTMWGIISLKKRNLIYIIKNTTYVSLSQLNHIYLLVETLTIFIEQLTDIETKTTTYLDK